MGDLPLALAGSATDSDSAEITGVTAPGDVASQPPEFQFRRAFWFTRLRERKPREAADASAFRGELRTLRVESDRGHRPFGPGRGFRHER
jgi:hypothetical protein